MRLKTNITKIGAKTNQKLLNNFMKAKIWNFRRWCCITDERYLCFLFKKMLLKSGFNIVGFSEYKFNKYGYSCVFLLSESHLALHTFPEHNKTYIELSSCVPKQFKKFIKLYKKCKIGI